ncbi:universal stress protein [Echinococcus granulosus]|uniref:Universal stress protein n=1 Tax=Echinococcus granulosus TaxID=6210 RepID=U6IZ78_ECHGR|nr:universal stress protein [Echinococcus granulosus]EUB62526.1 universal stress protein [Echinococcus granulosus]CDS17115.1 universal stress protein [Echinococcus granulosus]
MPGYRRILFAVDRSHHCRRAFQWFLQCMWRSGAKTNGSRMAEDEAEGEDAITLIHVISPDLSTPVEEEVPVSMMEVNGGGGSEGVPRVMEKAFTEGKAVCQVFLQLASEAGATRCNACITVESHSAIGNAILRSARIRGADMIVMGSHGHKAIHRAVHLGSVSKYITRHSHIPVVVIPPQACPS